MRETQFTKKICRLFEEDGCLVYPIVAQSMGKAGWPDRLVVSRHGLFLFEFKGQKTRVQVRQRMIMQQINQVTNFLDVGTCAAWVIRAWPDTLLRLGTPDERNCYNVDSLAQLWEIVTARRENHA